MEKEENIREELKNMAPTLAALPKVNTRIQDSTYFEKMNQQVIQQLKIDQVLAKTKEVTPQRSFETMQDEVLHKLRPSAQQRSRRFWPYALGIAASLTIGFVALFLLNGNQTTTNSSAVAIDQSTDIDIMIEALDSKEGVLELLQDEELSEGLLEPNFSDEETNEILEDKLTDEELESLI